jgi:hypothetical protein
MANAATPGHRPQEWWIYEKSLEPPEREKQPALLLQMGELGEAELTELMAKWREAFAKANQPGFAYCSTNAQWLTGDEARERFFQWVGIPPTILRQFEAERSRIALRKKTCL